MSDELNQRLDDAINRGEFEEVVDLINKGADIESRDTLGWTPLMNASWIASVEIVNHLIELGADINYRNNDGLTALEMIKSIGHNEFGHDEVINILEKVSKNDR